MYLHNSPPSLLHSTPAGGDGVKMCFEKEHVEQEKHLLAATQLVNYKMLPNIKSLRMLLNMRLKEAVDELFRAVETTIAEYQQECCRSKEEKDRTIAEYKEKVSRSEEENARLQRLLDVVLKPEIRLQRLEGALLIS